MIYNNDIDIDKIENFVISDVILAPNICWLSIFIILMPFRNALIIVISICKCR